MKKLAALLILPLMIGCKQRKAVQPEEMHAETYHLRGKVVNTDLKTGEVNVNHEAIPGFMEAMTMPYKLADQSVYVLKELHPGDRITADLLVDKDKDGEFHHARLDHIVVIAQANPDYKPTAIFNVPAKGQQVPDFHLTNQDGKAIHLAQYKGKALLVTFIYTRCPLADFCPKMSHNFAEINAALQKDRSLYDRTHLLSISFDPAYDTPSVLRSYGGAYTGNYTKEKFDHWEFASATKGDDLDRMEHFFQVGVSDGDGSTINHSLSTVLIAPDGTIAAWYPSNDWIPASVLADMKSAAGGNS